MIEGRDETSDDYRDFIDFLMRSGFSELVSDYDPKSA